MELQVAGYSLCGGGIAGLKSQSSCMEAELRNFKSYLIYCMEAELRNFQVTVFSLCGSGIAPIQSSQVTHYSVCGSGTAELLSLNIFLVRRRNFKPKNISCVEAEMQNFKSHNSLCAEAELQVT